MSKNILIAWNITEPVIIQNSASSWQKDTSNLEKDNALYIDVLDYWTNLIKIFFSIPGKEFDTRWVDLVYESTIDWKKKLIDIKTQANITNALYLYIREFNEDKLPNRNFIIFNKKDKQLFGNIYFLPSHFISKLEQNQFFLTFLEEISIFDNATHNEIKKNPTQSKQFSEIFNKYNNKEIPIDETLIKISFLQPRRDKNWIVWNTSFQENIRIEISL